MDDQEVVIRDDSGTEHLFPAGFDPQRAIAIVRGQSSQQASTAPSGSMGLAGLKALQPIAESVATSPTLPRTAASVGRIIGGVAPAIGGAYEAGPVGALAGLAAAAKGAWAGGKTGWFTGKLLQNMAAPIASGLDTIAPALGKASSAAGVVGIGDLAQMADPDRKDIGFLGIGGSATPDPSIGQRHRDKAIAEEQSKQEAWDRAKSYMSQLRQRLAGQ